MNITFLIGNGFDLNLGLKTSYRDFYKYFVEHYPDNIIAKAINKDYELWADLEFGLGQYLSEITTPEEKEDFLDGKEELDKALIEYLTKENERFRIDDKKALSNTLQQRLVHMERDFSPREQEHFRSFIAHLTEPIKYCSLDFNYTSVVDSVVNAVSEQFQPFVKRKVGNTTYNDNLMKPIHVHGNLHRNLIIGVNDNSQINNATLKGDIDILETLVKPRVNESIGYYAARDAKNTIDGSIFIGVFGMSIGDTDRFWWQYLISWLLSSTNRRLILYVKDDTVISGSAGAQLRYDRKKRKILLGHKKLTDDQQKRIHDQVIIVTNSDIFDLKGITVTQMEEDDGQAENGN